MYLVVLWETEVFKNAEMCVFKHGLVQNETAAIFKMQFLLY